MLCVPDLGFERERLFSQVGDASVTGSPQPYFQFSVRRLAMKRIKVLMFGLFLSVAGVAYAASGAASTSMPDSCAQMSCCTGDSCQMGGSCCAMRAKKN
jgi:hypothetical protein